jgi:polyferredoxin
MTRISLTSNPTIRRLLVNRFLQWALFVTMLAGFLFAILTGLTGTPVGSHNFNIVFVWIAWWAMLILVAVPFLGRSWCAVCPIPLPGEWMQRGNVLGPGSGSKVRSKLRRWPRALRNIWLQNISFTLVALFSSVLLTNPTITSIVLASMIFLAVGLSMVFERRAFCRYLCPVGGFIGLYAQAAPIELRIENRSVCLTCESKACYNGSSRGYGCPWDVFPGGLTKNTYCGLCMECLRTCPHDNIAINLRPFAADLANPSARLDEAFKAFIMLGSSMIYAGILLGPWGILKNAAFQVGTLGWLLYAAAFVSILFLVLPGTFFVAVKMALSPSRMQVKIRTVFAEFASVLIPLGLMFWVAFSLSFVLTNATYILMVLSDPFGWGWNLFGTASVHWQPILSWMVTPLQTLALASGLVWSAGSARRLALERGANSLPIIIFCLILTIFMAWLLL